MRYLGFNTKSGLARKGLGRKQGNHSSTCYCRQAFVIASERESPMKPVLGRLDVATRLAGTLWQTRVRWSGKRR